MATIGEGREIEFVYEWKIEDFLSLSCKVGEFYKSPLFKFGGVSWYLRIYPNGEGTDESVAGSVINTTGHVGLYLFRNSSGSPINIDFTLSLKTVEWTIDSEEKLMNAFVKGEGLGFPGFLPRSELLAGKSQLMPSKDLTILCKMKYSKSAEDKKADEEASDEVEAEDSHESKVSSGEKDNDDELGSDDERCSRNKNSEFKRMKNLGENLKQALSKKEFSDIVLKVEEREFNVHKIILAARSCVFESMFTLDMTEKKTNEVVIPDCTAKAFEVFLQYLYSGSADDLSKSNVYNLYYAADKYQVADLKKLCVEFMTKNLSVETVCGVVLLSLKHGESKLLKDATGFFCENIKKILKTLQWQKFLKKYSTYANELLIKAHNA